jgi:hypothetical protein
MKQPHVWTWHAINPLIGPKLHPLGEKKVIAHDAGAKGLAVIIRFDYIFVTDSRY